MGQTRVVWGNSGVCGSGERAKGRAARIPELNSSPTPQTLFFLGGVLPCIGNRLGYPPDSKQTSKKNTTRDTEIKNKLTVTREEWGEG